jgi:hypothetical protein
MTIRKMFESYFNEDGFLNPLSNYCNKGNLSFEEEKILKKVMDRICKHFEIVKEIQNIEDGTLHSSNIILHGIHCELFSNLISIYKCAERLFLIHIKSETKITEVHYWEKKYKLSNEDKILLSKPNFNELLTCNSSTLEPQLVLKVYKDSNFGVTFNCYDFSLNSVITDGESIRTKYASIQSIMLLFNYLITFDKFIGMDEKFQTDNSAYYDVHGMEKFIKIGEEFLEL